MYINIFVLSALALIGTGAVVGQARLVEGNRSSTVRVIIYEDMQCPDCAEFRKQMDERLLPQFGRLVAFEHRDFPLHKHAWARQAAIAARFFGSISSQEETDVRRFIFSHQAELNPNNFLETLETYGRARGVNPRELTSHLNDDALSGLVDVDRRDGIADGIAYTPTVLVNGEAFVERFAIEELIQCLARAVNAGTKHPVR
jgi:protein-disulfide isomerase